MNIIPVTPPVRSLALAPSGDASVCIVERIPGAEREEEMIEVRNAAEAVRLIGALVVAFNLPALPPNFGANL